MNIAKGQISDFRKEARSGAATWTHTGPLALRTQSAKSDTVPDCIKRPGSDGRYERSVQLCLRSTTDSGISRIDLCLLQRDINNTPPNAPIRKLYIWIIRSPRCKIAAQLTRGGMSIRPSAVHNQLCILPWLRSAPLCSHHRDRGSIMKDTVDRMRGCSSHAAGAGFTFVFADGFSSSVTGRFVRCSGSLSCSTTLRSDL